MEELLIFTKIAESTPENWESLDPGEHVWKRKYKDNPSPPKPGKTFEGLTIFGTEKRSKYHLKKGNNLSYTILKGDKNLVLVSGNPDAYTDENNV